MTKLFAIAFALSTLSSTAALADAKIAVVDLQRALEETEDGKKAKAKLKSDFDKKQKELDDKQEALKKKKEDLDKKLPLMKPEAAQAAQKEFQEDFVNLQQIYARLQKDLAAREQEATGGIFRKLQAVVGQLSEKNGFDVVLEKNSAVVWGKASLDITNEVIRTYNSQGGGKSK